MNLKDALLCIDCDEIFTIEGSVCNPQCPNCASSVFTPLSAWIQSWTAHETSQNGAGKATSDDTSPRKPGLELVHPKAVAA